MSASRCRSRSPLKYDDFYGRSSPTPSNASSTSNASLKSKYNAHLGKTLRLSNLPGSWKWHQVSDYIKRVTKEDKTIGADITFVTLKPDFKHNELQTGIVLFKTSEKGMQACKKLRQTQEKVEGRKIFVHLPSETPNFKNSRNEYLNPNLPSLGNNMAHNVIGENVNITYGLSAKYLADLGITPPLTRKVFVRYLPEEYSDEGKLRSVFGMAGTLLTVQVLKSSTYYNARLEYDHPVEAVQAVSMFNKQELMNRMIKCEMDSVPMRKPIDGHGPGLGPDGTPMLGVRVAIELKQVKHEIMNEVQKLNETIDELKAQVMNLMQNQTKNTATVENTPNVANPLLNLANPIQNVTNPLAALGTLLTNQLQPVQLLQTLLQLNSGNDTGGVLGNAIQSMLGSNIGMSSLLQKAQATNQSVQGNMQSAAGDPPNMQSAPNTQGGPNNMPSGSFNNMQSEPNMQDGPNNIQGGLNNMQGGPNNMQGGPNNMQGGPNNMPSGSFNNMQSGPQSNTQGPNMQRGPNNMPSGSFNNMQSGPQSNTQGPNMQRGPNNNPFNVQSSPENMQLGPNNMQSGPNNMQTGPNNMQIRPNSIPRGPNNMPSGPNMSSVPFNMPIVSANMQSGPPIMQPGNHPFIPAQNINPGFNMQLNQPNFASMPSGITNMQMPQPIPNQQIIPGFGRPQFNTGQAGHESSGPSPSTMLLFTNLPNSVTLPALQGKMREVGILKLIEMTGPGRALVSFYSNLDAEKCINLCLATISPDVKKISGLASLSSTKVSLAFITGLFNQSKVDGHTIEVKKV